MSRKSKSDMRVSVDGGDKVFSHNPFANLSIDGLPEKAPQETPTTEPKGGKPVRGKLDLRRETAGRHGKTVVVITPVDPMAESHLRELARGIQRSLGVGGTVKERSVEIQGDRLAEIRQVLEKDGYRCRQTGG
jgi:translation initiation factor 1